MSNPSLQRALGYELVSQEDENRDKVHRNRSDLEDVSITPSQAER